MRKLIPIVLLLIVLTSCRVNISGQESRREGNIREMGSPPEFKNVMDSGVIIAEERHENFHLILVKNTQNENLSFFVVEMIQRRHGKSGSYKRKINVYKLTGNTGKILSLDEQNLKAYKRLPLHAICNFLNKQNVPRNFTKVAEIYGGTGYNNVTKRFGGYYRGLYQENDPYDASRIVSIDTPQSYLEAGPNYDSGPLHFNPNPSDSILHYREKGRPKWWYFDSSKRAGMVPPKEDSPKVKPTGSPNDSLPVYDLNYSCTKNWNFHIKIYPEAEKGKIQISKEPKADSFFTYSYGPIFNPANFSIWLGNKFPGISPDCAGAIADQINATIYLYLKCTLCANFQKGDSVKSTVKADTTRKGTGKVADKKAAGVALPDNVSILPTATTKMHPVYNTKAKPKRDTVHIKLQLSGPYDQEHNQVGFVIHDSLSNGLKLAGGDTLITISEKEWNAAIQNGGVDEVVLHIITSPLKDTMQSIENASLMIIGAESNGEHLFELDPSVYNASAPFWIELGTNFDLLDGISMNNLYAGVYMFNKDVARIGPVRNLSFTGGVYESKATSFSFSSDSGFAYRDGSSYIFDTTHKGYPVYRDTGTISTTSVVSSIGVFFSPHLRLTKGFADGNGYHIFFSLYAEMLWQRVKMNFDYSSTHRLDTTYFNAVALGTQVFKEKEINMDFRSHYLGVGFPIYIRSNTFNLYINDVFGFSTQRFIPLQQRLADNAKWINPKVKPDQFGAVFGTSKHYWNPFYIFQFRLNEEKYGITFSGEVRGFFLRGSSPIISLALSKKFDVADLFNTLVKPFSPGIH